MAKYNFSVIIPAYNEANNISKCIKSVMNNDSDNIKYEITVVDNGSADGTIDIVKASGINIIENIDGKRKNIGVLRNIGAKVSNGNILAFLDADMIVPYNWLQKAKEYFDNGFKGALGFVEDVPTSAGLIGQIWGKHLYLKQDKVKDVDFLPGRNIFINRHIFEKINGFNEALNTAEDKDLIFRVLQAGFRAISIPEIFVVHLGYEKNIREFFKKEFWRQGSTLQFARQWGFSFRTIRNPILSLWHIFLLFSLVISIIFFRKYFTFLFLFLWISPSVLITFYSVGLKRPLNFLLLFFSLTFLRWNVAGLSIICQIFKGIPFRR